MPVPGNHPLVEIHLLVEQAHDNGDRRHRVQDGEDSDAQHQLFQLIRLRTVVLHHRPNTEQRNETQQEEDGTDDQVDGQRSQHESAQHIEIPQADVANTGQYIACKSNKSY